MQIFSTWGTKTWRSLIIVCNGSFARHAKKNKINPIKIISAGKSIKLFHLEPIQASVAKLLALDLSGRLECCHVC